MRSKVLRTFFVLEAAFYILALVYTPLISIWFSLGVFLIGLHEILKYFLFGADSFLWAGGIFVGVGVVGAIKFFASVPLVLIFPWYIFAIAFSSFLVFVFFRQYIHLKIFLILSLVVVLLLVFCYNVFV